MTRKEAWLYAAEWGSAMTAGDPGACMYGFDERFLPQSAQHRQDCLKWIEGCKEDVRKRPQDFAKNELKKLDRLADMLRNSYLLMPPMGTKADPAIFSLDAD